MAGSERAGHEVRALRVGVYDLYWATLGGGEQVDGTIAQVLAEAGHDVTLLGPRPPDVERTRERLGVDLSGCDHRAVHDDDAASAASADFDVFVNGTYLSRAVNHAELGYYYVHFPQVPLPPGRSNAQPGRTSAPSRGSGRCRSVSSRCVCARPRPGSTGASRGRTSSPATGASSPTRASPPSGSSACGESSLTCCTHRSERRCSRGRSATSCSAWVGSSTPSTDTARSSSTSSTRSSRWSARARPTVGSWRSSEEAGPPTASTRSPCKRAAIGHRVEVHINAPGALVEQLLGEASIYWHAAGFGEDPRRHPDRFEHFGIALVEAMAAGAAPVVYGAAGPAEIVRDGVDGDHWRARSELIAITTRPDARPRGIAGPRRGGPPKDRRVLGRPVHPRAPRISSTATVSEVRLGTESGCRGL